MIESHPMFCQMLLTYDRVPKCDPARIREINSRYRHNIVVR